MDKTIMLAVAGSGKTTYIVSQLCLTRRHLLLCYTKENYAVLRKKIIQRFNYFPPNIFLFSLFSFLYSFCYRPLCANYAQNGLSFKWPANYSVLDVISSTKQIFHSRLSKVILNKKLSYLRRINKYFDCVFIDEVQDFASYDFDWLLSLGAIDIPILAVGDFYQHTFDSSICGNKNKNLYKDKQKYLNKWYNFTVDTTTLSKSYRCPPKVCDFISNNIGIAIESHNSNDSEVIFVSDSYKIDSIINNSEIQKLFYKEHYKYLCQSNNWGNCKGNSYRDVCVVLNSKTSSLYKQNKLQSLPPSTRAKLYVACSRTKGNLYFVDESKIVTYKTEQK